jgi:hypothetical protein
MNELKKILKILMEFDINVYSGSKLIFKKKISVIDHNSESKPVSDKFNI